MYNVIESTASYVQQALLVFIPSIKRVHLIDWLASLCDLETSWHHILEDTCWVILFSHSLDMVIVLLPVAGKRVLCLVSIVKVDVGDVRANTDGIFFQLVNKGLTETNKEIVF